MDTTEIRTERPAGFENLTKEEYQEYWWRATKPCYQGQAGRERLARKTGLPVLPPEIAKV